MSRDQVGDEPLNLALARPPPTAANADFYSKSPATQIGDMPLFLLLWPGCSRTRAMDRAPAGQVSSPQLEIPTTPPDGPYGSSILGLI